MKELPASFEAPVVRQRVADIVARRILDLVVSGTLKKGDQLPPERELAASLNVSRPSVREAIRGLAILGVVVTRQGGGAYISELDAEALLGPIQFYLSLEEMNVRDLYAARSLIESTLHRLRRDILEGQLASGSRLASNRAVVSRMRSAGRVWPSRSSLCPQMRLWSPPC